MFSKNKNAFDFSKTFVIVIYFLLAPSAFINVELYFLPSLGHKKHE